jgi:hypothetical protein
VNRNPEVDRWFDEADHPLDATMRRARPDDAVLPTATSSKPAEPSSRPSSEPGASGRRANQGGPEHALAAKSVDLMS